MPISSTRWFSSAPRTVARALASSIALILGACSSGDSTAPKTSASPSSLQIVAGDAQTGVQGQLLQTPLAVRLQDAAGIALKGVSVTWTASAGSVAPATSTTDASGTASTTWTLGSSTGSATVTANAPGVAPVTFQANVQSASGVVAGSACAGATPVALRVGEVLAPGSGGGSALCVTGGTTDAEFVMVPFSGSTTAYSRTDIDVTASGIVAPTTPDAAIAAAATAPNGILLGSRSVAGLNGFSGSARSPVRSISAEVQRRQLERRYLTGRVAGARRTFDEEGGKFTSSLGRARAGLVPSVSLAAGSTPSASSGASSTAAAASLAAFGSQTGVPAVGAFVSLNTQPNDPCSSPTPSVGRVAAVTQRAIVVADTLNPANGFTDAEYREFGMAFDTLVYPLDTKNFGAPADVDNNGGRAIIFFTRAVNAMTPANSSSYVGGFFFARDLFPQTAANPVDACPGSNVAEMFYMLVPDPTGAVNGNTRTKSFVSNVTVSVLAHEFQHLINASRRLYINKSPEAFEEVWLNEGLSHVAEELAFYRASGLAPGQNIGASLVRSSQRSVDAFNGYQGSNEGRLATYLGATATSSPYAPDDSLTTRGATWDFLRYVADRTGGTESTLWSKLVNSQTIGFTNLKAAVNGDLTDWLRDWSVAQYADDLVSGLDARYTLTSWDQRSIFTAIASNKQYPLIATTLADATPAHATLAGGGSAYFRFAIQSGHAAGVTTRVNGQALPATMRVAVVRIR